MADFARSKKRIGGNKMEWGQVATIIGVNAALIGLLATMIIWSVSKMDSDVKAAVSRLDGHAARIDQIYGVILAMLKDGKK